MLRGERMIPREDLVAALDERHPDAEPDEDLRHLHPDHASAQDHQARRQLARRGRIPAGPVRHLVDAGDGRHDGAIGGDDDVVAGASRRPSTRAPPPLPGRRCPPPLGPPGSRPFPSAGRDRRRRDSRSLPARSSSRGARRHAPSRSRPRRRAGRRSSTASSTACTPRTGTRLRPGRAPRVRRARRSLPRRSARLPPPHPHRSR